MNIVKGTLVRSIAGRDRDLYYVAVEASDRFVKIANGKERKLENPKQKNRRHISPTDIVIETEGLTNKKLRKLLFELKTQGPKEAARPDENR